jgi:hypothetical protein
VHIGHEHFPVIGQSAQKGRVLAIPSIDPYPTKSHTVLASAHHHLEGQLRLALQDHLGLRNTGRHASLAILRPLFGKVQTSIDQSRVRPLRQSSKNRYLTVLHFTQAARPLPGHSHGLASFFLKGTLVEQKTGVRGPTEMAVRFSRHLIQHGTGIPVGIGEKVLERLVVAIGNGFLHPFHVFATRLHQTLKILAGLDGHRTSPAPEVHIEAFREVLKPLSHPFKRGWNIGGLLGLTSL